VKTYLTVLAFAVASEHLVKSIDPASPKIGGVQGSSIEGYFLAATRKTSRSVISKLNKHFTEAGLPPIVKLAPRPTGQSGSTVYRLNTNSYAPDFTALTGVDLSRGIRDLVDLRPARA